MVNGDYVQSIGIVVLFFVILFGAYYAMRYLSKVQFKKVSDGNMSIVEVLSIGQQKTLQLIRVGNKYMVIAVAKEHVTFVRDIDETDLSIREEAEGVIPFSHFIKKFTKQQDYKNDKGEESDEH